MPSQSTAGPRTRLRASARIRQGPYVSRDHPSFLAALSSCVFEEAARTSESGGRKAPDAPALRVLGAPSRRAWIGGATAVEESSVSTRPRDRPTAPIARTPPIAIGTVELPRFAVWIGVSFLDLISGIGRPPSVGDDGSKRVRAPVDARRQKRCTSAGSRLLAVREGQRDKVLRQQTPKRVLRRPCASGESGWCRRWPTASKATARRVSRPVGGWSRRQTRPPNPAVWSADGGGERQRRRHPLRGRANQRGRAGSCGPEKPTLRHAGLPKVEFVSASRDPSSRVGLLPGGLRWLVSLSPAALPFRRVGSSATTACC